MNSCCYYTSFRVNMAISLNATWGDSFQIGDPNDTSWNLIGGTFSMALKADENDTTTALSLTTTNGRIVIIDAIARIFSFNVMPTDLKSSLVPWQYDYDLLLTLGTDTVSVMHGTVCAELGIT
jgi:hypothetical protein